MNLQYFSDSLVTHILLPFFTVRRITFPPWFCFAVPHQPPTCWPKVMMLIHCLVNRMETQVTQGAAKLYQRVSPA